MDHVLHTNNVLLSKVSFHDVVIGDRNALSLLLGVSSLVDQLADDLLTRITPSDIRVGNAQHLKAQETQRMIVTNY